jgi:hypothetical protein
MRLLATILVLLSALWAQPAAAAEELPRSASAPAVTRTKVFIDHTGQDPAGRTFVSGLRDALRASTQFTVVESEDDASLLLVVVSVSPSSTASAVSLAYVANNEWRSLLGSAARFVGRERADAMGRATLAELSAVLAAYDPAARP